MSMLKSRDARLAAAVAGCLLAVPAVSADSPVARLVAGNTDFALDLYQQLSAQGGNLFCSPYSISTALALAFAGARDETQRQMAEAMRFSLPSAELHAAFAGLAAGLKEAQAEGRVTLHTANSLWPQVGDDLQPEYLDLTRRYHGVSITPLDYRQDAEGARGRINAWVEEQTQERIKGLLPGGAVDAQTRMVLASAIYFKGRWARQFNLKATSEAPFFVTAEKSVPVPLMQQQRMFRYAETNGLQVVELLYAGGRLCMLVLLPKDREGLTELEGRLTSAAVRTWTSSLEEREVRVQIPRFKLESRFELSRELGALGMIDAFRAGRADFSGIGGGAGDLYLSSVAHKAFVDVSEEGTEAAAATGAVAQVVSAPPPPVSFRADHPFIFLIQEAATGSVLFLGRLADPSAE